MRVLLLPLLLTVVFVVDIVSSQYVAYRPDEQEETGKFSLSQPNFDDLLTVLVLKAP